MSRARIRGIAHLVGSETLLLVQEVDGEGAQCLALPRQPGCRQSGDGAGIQTAGKQYAARHVGDQLPVDDVGHQFADPVDGGVTVVGVRHRVELPVRASTDSGAIDGDDGARPHLFHVLPQRPARRLRHGEQLAKPVGVDDLRCQRVRQDRLGLGAEQHAVAGGVVVERFDAHPVADHHQFVVTTVPDRARVHAVEVIDDGVAPLQIAVQDDLGVAVRAKGVTELAQLGAQFGEVVALAAVDHRDVAARSGDAHRWVPPGGR